MTRLSPLLRRSIAYAFYGAFFGGLVGTHGGLTMLSSSVSWGELLLALLAWKLGELVSQRLSDWHPGKLNEAIEKADKS